MTLKHNYKRVHNSQTFDDTHTYWRERCECGRERLRSRKLPKRKPKPKPMKRSKLKPMSESRQAYAKVYAAMKKAYPEPIKCAVCRKIIRRDAVSWHHPHGRSKHWMLEFIPACNPCHMDIHARSRWAKEVGWLQHEYDGSLPVERPKPWL